MNKKTYELVVGITGGLCAVAIAIVTFCKPAYATAINGAIAIGETAVAEICALFISEK